MHAPRQPHFEAVCRILRYLKGAPGRGLLYRPSTSLSVTGYSDADWAGSRSDRRSTSGYCTFVGENLVTWRSKKQTVVARSSAEAEYRAMAHTASEMLWVLYWTSVLLLQLLWRCFVIIKLPSLLLATRSFMSAPSISKWIVTLFAVAEAHCYSLCSIRGPIGLDSHEAPSSYFLSATNLQAGHV